VEERKERKRGEDRRGRERRGHDLLIPLTTSFTSFCLLHYFEYFFHQSLLPPILSQPSTHTPNN
jgi:hypothetical protein